MANVMDYIKWRGDLLFSQDSPNAVDTLVFSIISYLHFDGHVLREPLRPIPLREAAEEFLTLEDIDKRIRAKNDLELLKLAAQTVRFGDTQICCYQDLLIPYQDTQFAAMTFLLDDGSMCVAFRGTDNTLVGWKEDFNMCFQQTIPAQRLAQQYIRDISLEFSRPMRLCGHSKGGNLAVFAAARSAPAIQKRMLSIYNHDGPGFSDYLMGDPGYLAMVPKIHTFVPQSSLIGMIMDHEEDYTIVKSKQVSILQHDPFSWEIMGKQLVPMKELTADSRFFNRTIKNWLAGMTYEERNQMVDVLFDLLSTGNVDEASEIFRLKNIRNYIRAIAGSNNSTRKVLTEDFVGLLEAARQAHTELEQQRLEQKKEAENTTPT